MKTWKFLILVGGIAGIVGFFQPFVRGHVEQADVTISFSAYQLVRGLDVKELVHEVEQVGKAGRTRVDAERVAKDLEEGTPKLGGAIVLVYSPALLLALLGVFAVARGRLGRLGGFVSVLLGAISAAVWGLLYMASHEAKEATITLGLGAHLLLVAGIAGIIAGLGALVSPDRGRT
jgi:hypothetical protein